VLGGRFEAETQAAGAVLPSHSTINEVGHLLSDRLLGCGSDPRQMYRLAFFRIHTVLALEGGVTHLPAQITTAEIP